MIRSKSMCSSGVFKQNKLYFYFTSCSSEEETGQKTGTKKLGRATTGLACEECLQDDINAEQKEPPDKTIDLDDLKLDEEKIHEWWIGWTMSGQYSLTTTNCCWVIYEALPAGGTSVSVTPLWTPTNTRPLHTTPKTWVP